MNGEASVGLPERWHKLSAEEVPAPAIPEALGVLGRLQGELLSRLMASSNGKAEYSLAPEHDRLLTAEEAAELLCVTKTWMYRNADKFTFTRRLSPKMLRFSEAGLRRFVATRRR